jgi:hypothetical protein
MDPSDAREIELLRGVVAALRSRRPIERVEKPVRPSWQMLFVAVLAGFVLGVATMIALSYFVQMRV